MFSKFIPVYLRCLYFVKAVSDMNDSMTRTSGLVSSEFTLHRSPSTDVTIYVLDVGRLSPRFTPITGDTISRTTR